MWLVPVWTGHGCWSPDLFSLFTMLIAGGLASGAAAWAMPRVATLPAGRVVMGMSAVLVAFALTLAWAWPWVRVPRGLVPGTSGAAAPDQPAVAWHETFWGDVFAKLAPLMVREYPVQPVATGAGGGRALLLVRPFEGQLRDMATGKTLTTIQLPPESFQGHFQPTAASLWGKISVVGDLAAFEAGNCAVLVSLATGQTIVGVEDAAANSTLVSKDGAVILSGPALTRYGPDGKATWSVPAPRLDPDRPMRNEVVGTYLPDYHFGSVHLVSVAGGYAFITVDSVSWVTNDGRLLTTARTGNDLILRTTAASPSGDVVYVNAVTFEGRPLIIAYDNLGHELWRRPLRPGVFSLDWVALPSGLAIDYEWAEDAAGNSPPPPGVDGTRKSALELLSPADGRPVWSVPGYPTLVCEFYELGGDILAASKDVRRISAADGTEKWRTAETPQLEYYREPLRVAGTLVFPGFPVRALDPTSGAILWTFNPVGGSPALAGSDDSVLIATSRGLTTVRLKGP